MKYKKNGICCCILFLLASVYSIHLLEEAKIQYASVSLRYYDGISTEQVKKVKHYLKEETLAETASNPTEDILFPTFWKEEKGTLKAGFKNIETQMIVYLGEGYQAYGVEFLAGGYPIEGDSNGCAISDSLSSELYGSTDVMGLEFAYKEENYTVRGVFKDENKLSLFAGEYDENYTVVELIGDMKGDSEGNVTIFVENSGLDTPDLIVYGSGIISLLEFACNLPLLVLVTWLSLYSISLIQNRYPSIKEALWLIVLFILAYRLPTLLEQIPQWMLPSRWSDFAFWQSLFETMILRIEEWFYLQATMKDVVIKFIVLKIVLLAVVQSICTYNLYIAFQSKKIRFSLKYK